MKKRNFESLKILKNENFWRKLSEIIYLEIMMQNELIPIHSHVPKFINMNAIISLNFLFYVLKKSFETKWPLAAPILQEILEKISLKNFDSIFDQVLIAKWLAQLPFAQPAWVRFLASATFCNNWEWQVARVLENNLRFQCRSLEISMQVPQV